LRSAVFLIIAIARVAPKDVEGEIVERGRERERERKMGFSGGRSLFLFIPNKYSVYNTTQGNFRRRTPEGKEREREGERPVNEGTGGLRDYRCEQSAKKRASTYSLLGRTYISRPGMKDGVRSPRTPLFSLIH